MSSKEEKRDKFVKLLKEMFQFDQADLDFGIYRIMNQKRDRIEKFMNEELFLEIEKAIEPLKTNLNQKKVEEISNKISTLESMNDDGSFDNKISELKEEMASYDSNFNLDMVESEIYSHLIEFFSRYYDEGDIISQRRYKDGVYAIPYEGEEVKLHWANYDQYYVKSSEYFSDYSFKTYSGKKVNFKLLDVQAEKDNNKGVKKTFQVIQDIDNNPELIDGELFIYFQYTEDKTKQKKRNEEAVEYLIEKINNLKLLDYEPMLRKGSKGSSSEIEKQINRYTARNTYDYFIHKDLKGFLTRELEFYIKNEVIHLKDMNPEKPEQIKEYLTKAKIVESIAKTIIEFLTQLEEFQKSLWLKKKFVIDANYCITLDRIDEKYYSEIVKNDAQREEWIKLFIIDELEDYTVPLTEDFLKNNPYLMLDTKFFDDSFKDELIGSIDNLDESVDGTLINSDNFHALNLLQEKYREKIDCVYIDPPYNTGSDGFIYKDGYEESSWMSMMFDRLDYSNNLMKSSGKTSISIDDKEENVLTLMCKEMFNSTKKIAVKMSEASGVKMSSVKALGTIPKYKEYVVINSKEKILKGVNFKYIQKEEWDDEYNKFISGMIKEDYEEIKTLTSNDIIDDAELEKINKICSKWNIISVGEKLKEENILDSEKKTWLLENSYRIARTAASTSVKQIALNNRDYYPDHNIFCSLSSRDKIPYFIDASFNEESTSPRVQIIFAIDNLAQHPGDFWSDISTTGLEAEGSVVFKNGKKPLKLIDRLVDGTTNKDSIVLDFFAGSGTTAHVVIDLNREDEGNRKYILVEMGEYFDTVMLPRIQKVAYSKDWKDGKPVSREGISHTIKYFSLESYEDALNNISFEEDNIFSLLSDSPLVSKEYTISYMLFEETKESKCLLNIEEMKDPFNYHMKIVEKGEQTVKKINLIETFNYLIGLKVLKNYSQEAYDADFSKSDYGKTIATLKAGTTYKFKTIEGILPTGENTLIVWRNVTDNLVKSNEVLNTYLNERKIKSTNSKFDVIYVNGDSFIKNSSTEIDLKVKLIEEEIKKKMFEGMDVR